MDIHIQTLIFHYVRGDHYIMLFKTNQKEKYIDQTKKIPIKFDLSMLNMFIGYLFKKSVQITRKSLMNMKRLFDVIDESIYENNDAMEARIEFINKALEAKLIKGFELDDVIINYCKSDTYDKENQDIINNIQLYTRINYEEIKYINKCIEDRLQYYYLYYYKDAIYETIERLDSGDYKSFYEINNKLTSICTELINRVRSSKSLDTVEQFSLSDENFETNMMDIVTKLQNPSRVIKTGIQKLNEILSPGFLSSRLYIFVGLAGGWKSGMLLKVIRDTKLYNNDVQVKKPGKQPCALLITMENEVIETVERLFNMSLDGNIRNYTPKQVIKMIKETKEFTIGTENGIDVVIRYYPNRAISTEDLYTIIDDLSDDGKEVIMLSLDYIKRIRPAEKGRDEKEELKNISNELKSLAIHYDIPVVTAHQLNRAAASTVDAAIQANKEDLAKFLGRANIGSSWELVENADVLIILNIEKKRQTGQQYLTFKRVKIRYKDMSDLTYFNHPFNPNNKMQLLDDIYLDHSLSEDSLVSDFDAVDLGAKKGKRNAVERETIQDDDLFMFGKSLGTKT